MNVLNMAFEPVILGAPEFGLGAPGFVADQGAMDPAAPRLVDGGRDRLFDEGGVDGTGGGVSAAVLGDQGQRFGPLGIEDRQGQDSLTSCKGQRHRGCRFQKSYMRLGFRLLALKDDYGYRFKFVTASHRLY